MSNESNIIIDKFPASSFQTVDKLSATSFQRILYGDELEKMELILMQSYVWLYWYRLL